MFPLRPTGILPTHCLTGSILIIVPWLLASVPRAQAYEWRSDFHRPGPNGEIRTGHVHNGQLVLAGGFSQIDDTFASGLVIWMEGQWQPLTPQIGGTFRALASYDSTLVVAGGFSQPGKDIAAWTGSSWNALGAGLNDHVFCLVEFGGDLIAGGLFTASGTTPALRVARWDGAQWRAMGGGFNALVKDLAVFDGELYAAGSFTDHVARWDGSAWQPPGARSQ